MMDKTVVEKLLDKALNSTDAEEALSFAQAAFHAANALRALTDVDLGKLPRWPAPACF